MLSMNVLVQNHGKLNELKDNFDLADVSKALCILVTITVILI